MGPATKTTKELRKERLNIFHNANNVIERVYMG
jgi:hypothetical protein